MKSDYIALANKLISIPSVDGDPAAQEKCIDLVSKNLNNFEVSSFSKNNSSSILYLNLKKVKKLKIILNAHLDVVPGKLAQYKPIIKGDKLYGRGAYDMKAAGAVMVAVFNDVANQISYPLGLQIVCDEEMGGENGTKFQVQQGIRADFVISGEPTNFDIKYQAKGIIAANILFKGTTGHAAYPWTGDNAIEQAMQFTRKLLEKYPNPKKLAWKTTINVSRIETSNITSNKIPDNCILSLDIRFIPEDEKGVISTIKKLMPVKSILSKLEIEPSHNTDQSHPYINALKDSSHKTVGIKPNLIQAMGASDLRHFSSINIPGIEFGPIGEGHHTDHEWVSIKSLNQYYEILKNFLLSIDK